VSIAPLDTALDVEAKLAIACVPLVARSLPRLAAGTLEFATQDDGAVTHCRKLEKEDGALDFTAPASAVAARINGLFPWPASTVEIDGQAVKFGLADVADSTGGTRTAGEVIGSDAEGLLIATGHGVLRVRRLQRAGGRMLPATEFLRGCSIPAGTTLGSRPMRELVK